MWHKHRDRQPILLATVPVYSSGLSTPEKNTNKTFSHLNWKSTLSRQKSVTLMDSNSSSVHKYSEAPLTDRTAVGKQQESVGSGHKLHTILMRTPNHETSNLKRQSSELRTGFSILDGLANSCSSQNSVTSHCSGNKTNIEDILSFSRGIVKRQSIEVKATQSVDPADSKYVYVESPVVRDRPATFDSVISFAGSSYEVNKVDNLESKISTASSFFRKSQNQSELEGSRELSYPKSSESIQFTEGYKGDRKGQLRHGQGTYVFDDGARYEGGWYFHKMEGFGKLYYPSGKVAYEGYWKHDCLHGKGKLTRQYPQSFLKIDFTNLSDIEKNWVQYEGNFHYDKRSGYGKVLFGDGSSYQGDFKDNLPSGKGTFYNSIRVVKGIWFNGLLQRIQDQASHFKCAT